MAGRTINDGSASQQYGSRVMKAIYGVGTGRVDWSPSAEVTDRNRCMAGIHLKQNVARNGVVQKYT